MNSITRRYFSLVSFVVVILIISSVIGIVTADNIPGWYALLNKPSFNPPNWIFGPVWTVLYIMIAVSGWIVYQKRALKQGALLVYVLQLLLNFFWSFLFFMWHQIGWALFDILVLWFVILINIGVFYRYSKAAALLLLPYFLWVSFATVLNFSFWLLN